MNHRTTAVHRLECCAAKGRNSLVLQTTRCLYLNCHFLRMALVCNPYCHQCGSIPRSVSCSQIPEHCDVQESQTGCAFPVDNRRYYRNDFCVGHDRSLCHHRDCLSLLPVTHLGQLHSNPPNVAALQRPDTKP